MRAELKSITPAVVSFVTNMFGVGSEVYNAFGLSERKVAKKTASVKALAVEKLRATREARHTMGSRERLEIHGNVEQPAAPVDAPKNGTPHT